MSAAERGMLRIERKGGGGRGVIDCGGRKRGGELCIASQYVEYGCVVDCVW